MQQSHFPCHLASNKVSVSHVSPQANVGWLRCSVGATKPLISQTFCFDYPVARGIFRKYCPLSPSCAQSHPDANQNSHTHIHTHKYIYTVFLALARLGSDCSTWHPSPTRSWKLLPGFISVWDTLQGLQPGTLRFVWRKMAAGRDNSSCNSSLLECRKSQTCSLSDNLLFTAKLPPGHLK